MRIWRIALMCLLTLLLLQATVVNPKKVVIKFYGKPKWLKYFKKRGYGIGVPLSAFFTIKAASFAKLAFLTSLLRKRRSVPDLSPRSFHRVASPFYGITRPDLLLSSLKKPEQSHSFVKKGNVISIVRQKSNEQAKNKDTFFYSERMRPSETKVLSSLTAVRPSVSTDVNVVTSISENEEATTEAALGDKTSWRPPGNELVTNLFVSISPSDNIETTTLSSNLQSDTLDTEKSRRNEAEPLRVMNGDSVRHGDCNDTCNAKSLTGGNEFAALSEEGSANMGTEKVSNQVHDITAINSFATENEYIQSTTTKDDLYEDELDTTKTPVEYNEYSDHQDSDFSQTAKPISQHSNQQTYQQEAEHVTRYPTEYVAYVNNKIELRYIDPNTGQLVTKLHSYNTTQPDNAHLAFMPAGVSPTASAPIYQQPFKNYNRAQEISLSDIQKVNLSRNSAAGPPRESYYVNSARSWLQDTPRSGSRVRGDTVASIDENTRHTYQPTSTEPSLNSKLHVTRKELEFENLATNPSLTTTEYQTTQSDNGEMITPLTPDKTIKDILSTETSVTEDRTTSSEASAYFSTELSTTDSLEQQTPTVATMGLFSLLTTSDKANQYTLTTSQTFATNITATTPITQSMLVTKPRIAIPTRNKVSVSGAKTIDVKFRNTNQLITEHTTTVTTSPEMITTPLEISTAGITNSSTRQEIDDEILSTAAKIVAAEFRNEDQTTTESSVEREQGASSTSTTKTWTTSTTHQETTTAEISTESVMKTSTEGQIIDNVSTTAVTTIAAEFRSENQATTESITKSDPDASSEEEPEEEDPEQLFIKLNKNDNNNCLKRAICELEALKHHRPLTHLEYMFVGLFGTNPTQPSDYRKNLPSHEFHKAAYLGHSTKEVKQCREDYRSCTADLNVLLHTYSKIEAEGKRLLPQSKENGVKQPLHESLNIPEKPQLPIRPKDAPLPGFPVEPLLPPVDIIQSDGLPSDLPLTGDDVVVVIPDEYGLSSPYAQHGYALVAQSPFDVLAHSGLPGVPLLKSSKIPDPVKKLLHEMFEKDMKDIKQGGPGFGLGLYPHIRPHIHLDHSSKHFLRGIVKDILKFHMHRRLLKHDHHHHPLFLHTKQASTPVPASVPPYGGPPPAVPPSGEPLPPLPQPPVEPIPPMAQPPVPMTTTTSSTTTPAPPKPEPPPFIPDFWPPAWAPWPEPCPEPWPPAPLEFHKHKHYHKHKHPTTRKPKKSKKDSWEDDDDWDNEEATTLPPTTTTSTTTTKKPFLVIKFDG